MISTVLCGRFYKIFVSPMLHKNPSQISLRGIFRILLRFLLSSRLVKQVVLILSFLLSLFSGGRTEEVSGGSSQDVLYAVTEDQSHENTAGYAQNKELCITAAQGYSFSGDSNPNSVSIRVTQSGRRTQSQVRSTFRIIKGGKVIDNNHSHPFLAESIAHQAGMYVPQRYLFSLCRLRL